MTHAGKHSAQRRFGRGGERDGSPKGGDPEGGSVHDSPGPEGFARLMAPILWCFHVPPPITLNNIRQPGQWVFVMQRRFTWTFDVIVSSANIKEGCEALFDRL